MLRKPVFENARLERQDALRREMDAILIEDSAVEKRDDDAEVDRI